MINFLNKLADEYYKSILNLENYDILFYICNYEELRKELIRRTENYLNERRRNLKKEFYKNY